MRLKSVICLSVVGLLAFSGVASISSSIVADGIDNNSSSSQSSISTSSIQSSSSSSYAATSSSAKSPDTVKTRVAPQTDPPAPTAADGVKPADISGIYFNIPVIIGFQVQPQLEQYIVTDPNSHTVHGDMSFKAAFVKGAGEKIELTQTIFSWNGTKWVATADMTIDKGGVGGFVQDGNPYVKQFATNLTVGTYYVQLSCNFHGWQDLPGFHNVNKVSRLAKIVVVDNPVDATTITPKVPNVLFENATYEGTANPSTATGAIAWNSNLTDIAWNRQVGRNANFMIKDQLDTVNTDTSKPGIPVNFSSTITNIGKSPGTITGSTDSFMGGLAAKKMAADDGSSWSLDAGGLKDLEASINPTAAKYATWDYQWQYSDDSGKTWITMDESNSDGVNHFKGTVASANDLGNSDNALKFSGTSGFAAKAAAASANKSDYVLRENLTANIPDISASGAGAAQSFEINSNAASLTVSSAVGRLSLDEVPSFNFGNVTATDIYNGTSGKVTSEDSTLSVTDTRTITTSKYWSLKAAMSGLIDANGNKLVGATKITSKITGNQAPSILTDDGKQGMFKNSTGGSFTQSGLNGTLTLKPNHQTNLMDNQKFSSTITWVLAGSTPAAAALK